MSVCLYSCRPKRRVGSAIAVCAFFFCGAMIFSAVGLNNRLRQIFNLTALFMLVICFSVAKRFLATAYSYAVFSGDSRDLVIYGHTLADKEPFVAGRIAVADIVEARAVRPKKKGKKEKPRRANRRFYDYTVSVFEREYMVIIYADGDSTAEVRLTYDEGLSLIIGGA